MLQGTYQLFSHGGQLFRIDSYSGTTWFLYNGKWKEIPTEREEKLTTEQRIYRKFRRRKA